MMKRLLCLFALLCLALPATAKDVQTCPRGLTDEDASFEAVQTNLYRNIVRHWKEFPGLHNQEFIVLLDIAKNGTLRNYKALQGLQDKQTQVVFSTMLNHVFPKFKTGPLPSAYSYDNAKLLLTSQGIRLYVDHTNNTIIKELLKQESTGDEKAITQWVDQLNTFIQETWFPPSVRKLHRGEVMLSVAENGQILKHRIIQSTCSTPVDESILQALDNLPNSQNVKLPALPFKPALGYVQVLYTFETKRK